MNLATFESFETLSLSTEELALIDGGSWRDVGFAVGAAAGYVVGAISEFVGGLSDAAHDLNKK